MSLQTYVCHLRFKAIELSGAGPDSKNVSGRPKPLLRGRLRRHGDHLQHLTWLEIKLLTHSLRNDYLIFRGNGRDIHLEIVLPMHDRSINITAVQEQADQRRRQQRITLVDKAGSDLAAVLQQPHQHAALEQQRRSGQLSQSVSAASLRYQASKAQPGLLEEIKPNGNRRLGRFRDGLFEPVGESTPSSTP